MFLGNKECNIETKFGDLKDFLILSQLKLVMPGSYKSSIIMRDLLIVFVDNKVKVKPRTTKLDNIKM